MAKLDKSQKDQARAAVIYEEFERGWGSRVDDVEYYDSIDEAQTVVTKFNAHNTAPSAPDWYMVATLKVLK
jgi:hypothetical protein